MSSAACGPTRWPNLCACGHLNREHGPKKVVVSTGQEGAKAAVLEVLGVWLEMRELYGVSWGVDRKVYAQAVLAVRVTDCLAHLRFETPLEIARTMVQCARARID